MHFQAYVYIIFVYRVVYVDMSTRSSQLNHLDLSPSLSVCLSVCLSLSSRATFYHIILDNVTFPSLAYKLLAVFFRALLVTSASLSLLIIHLGFYCSARAGSPQLMQYCDLCYVDAQTSG